MSRILLQGLKLFPAAIGAALLVANPALAQQPTLALQESDPFFEVNSVDELSDVRPTDWAYSALQGLAERYGCLLGYRDGTYRGNRALTRYEFAAGLDLCMNVMQTLIEEATSEIGSGDLDILARLQEEFAAELGTLRARVDGLEVRTAELEANQFSTTTKLQGEAVFSLSDSFGGDGGTGDDNSQPVFQNRVRLAFVSSFTGQDALYTRLDTGNAATLDGIDQGAFTYSFDNGNQIDLGWLAYYFPIGDKIQVYLPAAFPLHVDYVPSISPHFDSFTGATGTISSFGESSPIYKIGLAAGAGIGVNYAASEDLMFSVGYLGGNSASATPQNGLFNGEYSALGQITWTPGDKFQLGLTYVNAYFNDFDDGNAIFDLGVGTANARAPFDSATITNSYGVAASYEVSPSVVANAYFGYTDAEQETGGNQDAEIWYYAAGLAFPDLGSNGSLGGLLVGAEPYVGGVDDAALHIEGFYKYQMSENISITPGLIWIGAPNGDKDNDGVLLGVLRTTFTF
ncbi:MAG: carbohydrate porin [Oscillatoria sp. SIO1A7]|nr:carbohydrate porin [Oscillatoria sp. SIO1A7]